MAYNGQGRDARALGTEPGLRQYPRVSVRLLAIPGSHPCAAVAAMLDAKRIAHDRVDLIPGAVAIVVAARPASTLARCRHCAWTAPCPGISRNRTSVGRVASPSPRSSPPIRQRRERIEEIEAWGDGPLPGRRPADHPLGAAPQPRGNARRARGRPATGSRFPPSSLYPVGVALPPSRCRPQQRQRKVVGARPPSTRCRRCWSRVDAWIQAGDLGPEQPTAADYQLAGSLRLLLTLEDLAPLLAERPAADARAPPHPDVPRPGPNPAVLPASWLR